MSCTVVTDTVKTKKVFVSIKQRFSDWENIPCFSRVIIEYQLVSFEYTSKCLNFTNVDIDIDLSKYEPTIFAAVSYTLSLSWWIDK